MQPRFTFEFEFETFEKAGAPRGRERRIGGIVSTDDLDKQQETLIQEGLDFGPFLKGGWFNDNHAKETGAAVGYPEFAELRDLPGGRKGWYVEGYLLKGTQRADEIWELATALERSGSGRRLGFSVEGNILERDAADPRTVRRAIVREIAVTRTPVNDQTDLRVLAKSLVVGTPAAPGNAAPLQVESLESKEDPEDQKKKKRKARALTKSQWIGELMRRDPRVTYDFARRVVERAARAAGGTNE